MLLSNLDIFRKIPRDLTRSTRHGGALSLAVFGLIFAVLVFETWTYMEGETRSRIVLDSNSESKLDINFELSFYELPCRFASIEAWDYLGNAKLDITGDIEKTVISGTHGEIHKGRYVHEAIPIPESVRKINDDMPAGQRVIEAATADFGALLKRND